MKFYASLRLDIRRTGAVKDGDDSIGNETRVKVVKNKVAPPFKKAEFQIMYDRGINQEAEILNLAVEEGIVEKAGAWYSYEGSKIGQGKANSSEYLTKNRDTCLKIERQLKEKLLQCCESEAKEETCPDEIEELQDGNALIQSAAC